MLLAFLSQAPGLLKINIGPHDGDECSLQAWKLDQGGQRPQPLHVLLMHLNYTPPLYISFGPSWVLMYACIIAFTALLLLELWATGNPACSTRRIHLRQMAYLYLCYSASPQLQVMLHSVYRLS